MANLSIKIKTENEDFIVNTFTENTTISELKSQVSQLTKFPEEDLQIFTGFPRKLLDLTKNDMNLKSCGIMNSDTLRVEAKPEKIRNEIDPNVNSDEYLARVVQEFDNDGEPSGILMKEIVPADNSCLFTSIGFALSGKVDTNCGGFMRKIIAEQVVSEKDTYTEAFLGKPNSEYSAWIQHPDTWGGAIEVSILAQFYGIEIDVVDIGNAIINRFGEDKCYGTRIFLLFNGIHYDPLYMDSFLGKPPRTVFPIEDEEVFRQAEQLAIEAKASRQFTSLSKFTLKCYNCESVFTGQIEARDHAKQTGHTKFDEI